MYEEHYITDYQEPDFDSGGGGMAVLLLAMVLVLFGALCTCSCSRTHYVPVERMTTDTLIITQHHRDSIHVHDSIHIRERGDTVRIERWHTSFRDRIVHDTTSISRVDTVTVVVQAPRPAATLSWWQRLRLRWGSWAMAAAAVVVVVVAVKICLHRW